MRAILVTVAVGTAVVFGGAGPAAAGDGGDTGLRSLCEQVAGQPAGGAELTTDPAPGGPLRAGETVSLTLRWDERAFAEPNLHRVAHCIVTLDGRLRLDRKSTRLNSSHSQISYAVF